MASGARALRLTNQRTSGTSLELYWAPVSVAEVYAGVRKDEEEATANLFLLLEPVPIVAETGRKAGLYLRSYAKSHGVELGDALIAACASAEDLPLWTLNRKHYPMKDIRFFAPDSKAGNPPSQ